MSLTDSCIFKSRTSVRMTLGSQGHVAISFQKRLRGIRLSTCAHFFFGYYLPPPKSPLTARYLVIASDDKMEIEFRSSHCEIVTTSQLSKWPGSISAPLAFAYQVKCEICRGRSGMLQGLHMRHRGAL
ncbi:hypothetical protein PDIG_59870 [Penicillium digitatum PHI26]|uniref:Uncharacterized protein n=2 Tax=Penicillium digitatum TaxID=36651 RepID=K9G914_PEND2|nr:hypothetical protein PDIP_69290 [Penicillium digitatum Pd1]EKV08243.1 hypothetical protein PDIP_69290 [Penicillium digitatum Pd1]EKV09746.1 hypothetical protein PDIG_59870 [Penicillium digitatum PHI26]